MRSPSTARVMRMRAEAYMISKDVCPRATENGECASRGELPGR